MVDETGKKTPEGAEEFKAPDNSQRVEDVDVAREMAYAEKLFRDTVEFLQGERGEFDSDEDMLKLGQLFAEKVARNLPEYDRMAHDMILNTTDRGSAMEIFLDPFEASYFADMITRRAKARGLTGFQARMHVDPRRNWFTFYDVKAKYQPESPKTENR